MQILNISVCNPKAVTFLCALPEATYSTADVSGAMFARLPPVLNMVEYVQGDIELQDITVTTNRESTLNERLVHAVPAMGSILVEVRQPSEVTVSTAAVQFRPEFTDISYTELSVGSTRRATLNTDSTVNVTIDSVNIHTWIKRLPSPVESTIGLDNIDLQDVILYT